MPLFNQSKLQCPIVHEHHFKSHKPLATHLITLWYITQKITKHARYISIMHYMNAGYKCVTLIRLIRSRAY